jgi:hypothetical protein
MQFTAVYRRVPEGYIGFVEELPGANTQAPRRRKSGQIYAKQWRWFSRPTAR